MAGLYATLHSSVKAIAAESRAIEITGKNLANVNNPSYARQRVVLGDRGTVITPDGAESLGFEALGLQQLRDRLLDSQVAREVSLSGGYQAEQSAYARAQAALGQGIDGAAAADSTGPTDSGLGAAIDGFFNSFGAFAANPGDDGERAALLQTAGLLTDRFRFSDQRLAQVQSDLTAQVGADVGDVNELLTAIAGLNYQIDRFEVNAPGSAVDLRDQREAKLEELATKLPVRVVDGGGGRLQLLARGAGGADVVLVDDATVAGPIAFDGTQLTGGAGGAVLALSSGSIQGALTARDGAVQGLRDNLDALAAQLVTAVNGAYNPGGTTGDFFDPTGTTAGSIAVVNTLTPGTLKASDGGPAGDNAVALAVAQLANREFSLAGGDAIDGTFSGHFARTVSTIGGALAAANARVDDQSKVETLVRSQRDAVSGVSLDEELANLMTYQRAFQASSRVFTVVDELLDTVVNRMGG